MSQQFKHFCKNVGTVVLEVLVGVVIELFKTAGRAVEYFKVFYSPRVMFYGTFGNRRQQKWAAERLAEVAVFSERTPKQTPVCLRNVQLIDHTDTLDWKTHAALAQAYQAMTGDANQEKAKLHAAAALVAQKEKETA